MKYTGGKSYWDKEEFEWKYEQRIYSNFYCSLSEWLNLNRGKKNFISQLFDKIKNKYNQHNLGFDKFQRIGYDNQFLTSNYENNILHDIIKEITKRDAEVTVCYESLITDSIAHIEISFGELEMPNLIVLFNGDKNLNVDNIIYCIDAIYDTLKDKLHHLYETRLKKYYNKNYDRLYAKAIRYSERGYYIKFKTYWFWNEVFKPKNNRLYRYSGIIDWR